MTSIREVGFQKNRVIIKKAHIKMKYTKTWQQAEQATKGLYKQMKGQWSGIIRNIEREIKRRSKQKGSAARSRSGIEGYSTSTREAIDIITYR